MNDLFQQIGSDYKLYDNIVFKMIENNILKIETVCNVQFNVPQVFKVNKLNASAISNFKGKENRQFTQVYYQHHLI